jgi:hypothetical protein
MLNYERIAAEWETIQSTEFWKEYHRRISALMDTAQNKCETDDVVARSQGELRAYRYILGKGDTQKPLAERILIELSQKGEK